MSKGRTPRSNIAGRRSQYDQLPRLRANLVSRKVAVIAAAFLPAALAAKAATSTIPICFVIGSDPVKMGLVSSLNRPGGNATGITFFSALVGAKRLGLLRELVPTANVFALLLNPTNPNAGIVSKDLQAAAQTLGLQIRVLNARTEHEIDSAFATLTRQPVGALIVGPDAFFDSRANQIVTLAARHAIPAMYERREVVVADGLMSYGASPTEAYHQPASTPVASSRARSPRTCRSFSLPSSNWSSISGPQKRLASRCRPDCSRL